MSQTPQASGLSRAILKQLSNPLKLRLVPLHVAMIVWCAPSLFFSTLSLDNVIYATTARITREPEPCRHGTRDRATQEGALAPGTATSSAPVTTSTN